MEVGSFERVSYAQKANGRVRDENRRMIDVLDRDANMTEERMQRLM